MKMLSRSSSVLKKLVLTAATSLFCIALPPAANAVQLTPALFGSTTVITDFDNGFYPPISSSLVINGNTYTASNNVLLYDSNFGDRIGQSGGGISNNFGFGFIDVVLGTAAQRVGGYAGGVSPLYPSLTAEIRVDFFDELNQLLGSVTGEAGYEQSVFAGWETDTGLIKRVRFNALSDTRSVLILDNFMVEVSANTSHRSVPEPGSIAGLLTLGLLTTLFGKGNNHPA